MSGAVDVASELVGVWQLVLFHDVDDDGDLHEGPLGSQPTGLLFYSGDGHVSVNMMRNGGDGSGYMSYAGTWRRDGDQVVHTISIAPDARWLGSAQVRDLVLDGDRLVLTGRGPSGSARRGVLVWQRLSY